jgi:DNA-directed RNA polymerase specialized sigma24 family protein
MTIINDNAKELLGVATAEATKHLGGEVGLDYTSWADDIAQDTMIILLELEEEGKIDNKYVAFNMVRQVAYHKATSFKSKELRRREIEQEHGDKINSVLTGQSAELLAADPYEIRAYEEMRERLDDLSPLLYSTTERHYMDGLSVGEIAEADEVTEDVVYKRLQRAREFIRDEQPDDIKTESTRPTMENVITAQHQNFVNRDRAYITRRVRRENPDATLAQWGEMYG